MDERTKFIAYAISIFVSYFYFGILQEKITRGRYGDEKNSDGTIGEQFTYAMSLVWTLCFFNWIFVKAMLLIRPQKEDTTHAGYYACSSLTYLLAMISSYMALRWVTFPTQVIGKSAKPIPVIILGVLLGRKSYPLIRYVCVFTMVGGIILFMLQESKNSAVRGEKATIGELLIFLSLAMDGVLGAIQERIRASSAPSGQQMMLATNGWSSIMLGITIFLTGEFRDFTEFTIKYPYVILNIATLAIAGALGQLFIFLMISGFGPLAVSVVTTTRKFFTVLCSVLLFGNVLNSQQWFGALLVFAGLFADVLFSKKSPRKPSPPIAEEKKLIS